MHIQQTTLPVQGSHGTALEAPRDSDRDMSPGPFFPHEYSFGPAHPAHGSNHLLTRG